MEGLRPKRFRFAEFEADLESGELFKSGKRVHLQAKPFALLVTLLQHHGQVVTREMLSARLWPDTHVQADQGLNAAVRKVRRALRDDAEDPKYIETLGSRGYRFIHPVQPSKESAENFAANSRFDDTVDTGLITEPNREHAEQWSGDLDEDPEDYLRGRYFLNLRNATAQRKALAYFNRATEKHPGSVLAHSGLADAYLSEGMSEFTPPQKAWELARKAAVKAKALDPNCADAYLPLAVSSLCAEHDWKLATESLEHALRLNPNLSYVYFWYSFFLTIQHEFQAALEMAKKAKKLDPLSLPIATALSFACFFAGDLEQAKHVAEKILELNDRYAFAYESLGFVCEAQGKLEHAVRQYEKAADYSGRWPAILGYLGYAYALSGNLTMARQVEHELEQKPEYVPSFEVAAIRLGLGDEEGCMRSLARAYGERSHRLLLLKNDARFERLSANADFRSLLSRVFKR